MGDLVNRNQHIHSTFMSRVNRAQCLQLQVELDAGAARADDAINASDTRSDLIMEKEVGKCIMTTKSNIYDLYIVQLMKNQNNKIRNFVPDLPSRVISLYNIALEINLPAV
jgi:hypothetical protein